jgi:hypothetical protein
MIRIRRQGNRSPPDPISVRRFRWRTVRDKTAGSLAGLVLRTRPPSAFECVSTRSARTDALIRHIDSANDRADTHLVKESRLPGVFAGEAGVENELAGPENRTTNLLYRRLRTPSRLDASPSSGSQSLFDSDRELLDRLECVCGCAEGVATMLAAAASKHRTESSISERSGGSDKLVAKVRARARMEARITIRGSYGWRLWSGCSLLCGIRPASRLHRACIILKGLYSRLRIDIAATGNTSLTCCGSLRRVELWGADPPAICCPTNLNR